MAEIEHTGKRAIRGKAMGTRCHGQFRWRVDGMVRFLFSERRKQG